MDAVHGTPSGTPLAADQGLRCPRCEYNLTGLSAARCPECGAAFDWETVRAAATTRPIIAFERARGRKKIVGFIQTWLAVLFAPWLFSRQAIQRVDLRHALAFLGVCTLTTPLCFVFDADFSTWAAWTATALLYILTQTFLLAGFEALLHGWRNESLHFWLCASCYTSAVMATEWPTGPPLASFDTLMGVLSGALAGENPFPRFLAVIDNSPWLLSWLQVGLWLLGVTCCLQARLRSRLSSRLLRTLLLAAFIPLSFALYAVFVEKIGVMLWDLFGGHIF